MLNSWCEDACRESDGEGAARSTAEKGTSRIKLVETKAKISFSKEGIEFRRREQQSKRKSEECELRNLVRMGGWNDKDSRLM